MKLKIIVALFTVSSVLAQDEVVEAVEEPAGENETLELE